MLYRVEKINRKAGEFVDSKTNKKVVYDNFYFYLEAHNDDGEFVNAICPKIKASLVRDTINEGDLVEVYNNEYKQPFMVVLVQKGDK